MSTLSTLGQRQQSLLLSLLHNRKGLTVDDLTHELDISRNAVNQHLNSLDSVGFIENAMLSSTGGRPSKVYTLSSKGLELFPRHYALFSNLLINWIKQKLGDEDLESCMSELGTQVAQEFKPRVQKHRSHTDKLKEVASIMQELGYEARVEKNKENEEEIIASNCVFHKLASESDEVCLFDTSLMSNLLDSKIDHKECMVRGGNVCRFSSSN
ncbi:MAG: HTH domain-containing protein [Ectothiorhodospiraceae bacterium]|nr:HTH domain-containing protein [Ectothiorhodospiraceae bacterium]